MNNRMSPYGGGYGAGGYNSYSSPYSSFGSGYGSMYGGMGGMGGMGSMYGGMGMGMGGMYGGMGMPIDPNNPASLTQSFSQSTAATFQLIENIVGAFGGFAQMLQSTYMATHSSFFGTSDTHASIFVLTFNSHGIRCRTVWKLTPDTRLSAWNLHIDAVDTDRYCKTHRSTTPGRCNGLDSGQLRCF
jgi:hypothetical protein